MEQQEHPAPQTQMPLYRSHKKVWALKIKSIEEAAAADSLILSFEEEGYAPKEVSIDKRPTPQVGWYYVVYADGYHSFSPAEQFESGNTPIGESPDTFKEFGWALKMMRHGLRVRRAGWNGKGMFIFLVPGSHFTVNRPPLLGIYPEGTPIDYRPHIDMKTAQGDIVPWVPSQIDLTATDWEMAD